LGDDKLFDCVLNQKSPPDDLPALIRIANKNLREHMLDTIEQFLKDPKVDITCSFLWKDGKCPLLNYNKPQEDYEGEIPTEIIEEVEVDPSLIKRNKDLPREIDLG
jgi:hypothetical protein